jgi:hypothetical protein
MGVAILVGCFGGERGKEKNGAFTTAGRVPSVAVGGVRPAREVPDGPPADARPRAAWRSRAPPADLAFGPGIGERNAVQVAHAAHEQRRRARHHADAQAVVDHAAHGVQAGHLDAQRMAAPSLRRRPGAHGQVNGAVGMQAHMVEIEGGLEGHRRCAGPAGVHAAPPARGCRAGRAGFAAPAVPMAPCCKCPGRRRLPAPRARPRWSSGVPPGRS